MTRISYHVEATSGVDPHVVICRRPPINVHKVTLKKKKSLRFELVSTIAVQYLQNFILESFFKSLSRMNGARTKSRMCRDESYSGFV